MKLFALIATVHGVPPALLLRQFVLKFESVGSETTGKGAYQDLKIVLIPACNEAQTIEKALRTLLQQEYPNLEVIVVNDRSEDDTGAIIDRIMRKNQRVRAVHIGHLPEGWLGKVHALKVASEKASGDFLLFSDADIHFSRDCLRRAVLYAPQPLII